jgi:hypothetical protein
MSQNKRIAARLGLTFFKSKALEKAVDRITHEILSLTTAELEELFQPTDTQRLVKARYWSLITSGEITERGSSYTTHDLHKNICSYTYLYNYILSCPTKVAWLVKLDDNSLKPMAVLCTRLIDKLSDIAHLEVFNENGKVNHQNALLVIKTARILCGLGQS